ncbi:hypothetical protein GCM10009854_46830 [Saccharopolyspora halophila]|uniref:DUF4231 domain-containing protein n=1 Tax=Saccharopolyspora halophila TaxID=405551 RepID=A0ABP5TUD4_9PSEU
MFEQENLLPDAREVSTPNEKLLYINHQIRELEHDIRVARRRRNWGNLSLVLGPVLLLGFYVLWWLPWVTGALYLAIVIPGMPMSLAFAAYSLSAKFHPGGPKGKDNSRKKEGQLELDVARVRESRKLTISNAGFNTRVRRLAYKEDAYSDIESLRGESKKYRRVNNILQGVLILGSLSSTAASGVAGAIPEVRWAILGVTFLVGASSGFLGYFKYKERSFYLQQTADSIEEEWEALEVGIGRYKKLSDKEALEEFSEQVHRLKSEQKKRQQNLEQPPELRGADDA